MDIFEPDPRAKRGQVVEAAPNIGPDSSVSLQLPGCGDGKEPNFPADTMENKEALKPDAPKAATNKPACSCVKNEVEDIVQKVIRSIEIRLGVKILWRKEDVRITSPVFRHHYRTTVFLLLVACLLISSEEIISGPKMLCFGVGVKGPKNPPDKNQGITDFCWMQAAYTRAGGPTDAHPGVGPKQGEGGKRYTAYYPWVECVLFLQLLLFRASKFIWAIEEGRKIKMITKGLRGHILDVSEKADQIGRLVKYFVESLHRHNRYAFFYFFCEMMSIANVVGLLYLSNRLLDGSFLNLGADLIKWIATDDEDRADPLSKVFPRVTKCDFHKYGPSGTLEKKDVMCVLPYNVVNEKVFVLLWFWYIGLAAFTAIDFFYTLLRLKLAPLKSHFIQRNTKCSFTPRRLNVLVRHADFGDWFVLLLMSFNMRSDVFRAFIVELIKEIERQELEGRLIWNKYNAGDISSDEDEVDSIGTKHGFSNNGRIRPSAPKLSSSEASPIPSTLTVAFEENY